MAWNPIADSTTLNGQYHVRVHFSADCMLFNVNSISDDSLLAALADQVVVTQAFSVDLNLVDHTISFSVLPGTTASDARVAVINALAAANGSKLIPCSNLQVGGVEVEGPDSALTPSPTQTISLVAIAIVGLVVVFLVIQTKEAI